MRIIFILDITNYGLYELYIEKKFNSKIEVERFWGITEGIAFQRRFITLTLIQKVFMKVNVKIILYKIVNGIETLFNKTFTNDEQIIEIRMFDYKE